MPLKISHTQQRNWSRTTVERRCWDYACRFKEVYPDALAAYPTEALRDRFLRCTNRMAAYGIHQQAFLEHIFDWDLRFGEGYETLPHFAGVLQALQSGKREPMKFDLMRNAMQPHLQAEASA